MNPKLKTYLQKFRPATVDKSVLDDLRKEMKEAVPEITDSIRQREELLPNCEFPRHGRPSPKSRTRTKNSTADA